MALGWAWTKFSDPVYMAADGSVIDCVLTIPGEGDVPFTASANDPEPHGREVYAAIKAGEAPIKPYVAPAARDLTTGSPPKVIG